MAKEGGNIDVAYVIGGEVTGVKATSSADWVTVGTVAGGSNASVTVAENKTGKDRTAEVTFSTEGQSGDPVVRTQHRINNDTGGDISTYDRYTKASYLLLSMLSSTLIFAVTWRPALYVVGPLMLFTVFLFVSSFVALGFNMAPVEDVLTEDETYGNASDYYNELADDDPTTISTGQIEKISVDDSMESNR